MPEKQTVGEMIDSLFELRAKRLAKSKEVDEMKKQEATLRSTIIAQLHEIGLDGGKGTKATAAILTSDQAVMEDWPAFWAFCRDNDALDLVQKRVSITAVRERWDQSEEIPGLRKIEVEDLSLNKRSS